MATIGRSGSRGVLRVAKPRLVREILTIDEQAKQIIERGKEFGVECAYQSWADQDWSAYPIIDRRYLRAVREALATAGFVVQP